MNQEKIRPAVPKFNLNSTQLNDITRLSNDDYKQESDETLLYTCQKKVVIDQKKLSISLDKRRLNGIIEELENQLTQLKSIFGDRMEEIEKRAIYLLTQQLVDKLKSKKYTSIATAVAIHAVRQLYLPITMKKIFEYIDTPEKQVKKILAILQSVHPIVPQCQIKSFLTQFCHELDLNGQFLEVCYTINDLFNKKNLIKGEHEHIVAATIIKVAGDVVFYTRGGMSSCIITKVAQCCDFSVKNLLKRIDEQMIAKELIEHYKFNLL